MKRRATERPIFNESVYFPFHENKHEAAFKRMYWLFGDFLLDREHGLKSSFLQSNLFSGKNTKDQAKEGGIQPYTFVANFLILPGCDQIFVSLLLCWVYDL